VGQLLQLLLLLGSPTSAIGASKQTVIYYTLLILLYLESGYQPIPEEDRQSQMVHINFEKKLS
jgi:hypothetical protein